jgi:hypothetical protein
MAGGADALGRPFYRARISMLSATAGRARKRSNHKPTTAAAHGGLAEGQTGTSELSVRRLTHGSLCKGRQSQSGLYLPTFRLTADSLPRLLSISY